MEATVVRARVAAGAAWLDTEASPEWPWEVDLATLNMADPFRCVLGQVFGGRVEEMSGYAYVLNQMSSLAWDGFRSMGFMADIRMVERQEAQYQVLTEEWARLILQRRAGS